MSGYIGNIPTPQATQTRDTFTATSGQTSFATSGYTPGFLDVYLNGVHLVNGTDYTASNGSDVVLTTGATTGDNLEVVSYSTYEVNAQTYTGGLTAKNDGAAAITANRLTSDGTILDLKKNGTTVGSIGVENTYLTIGKDDTNLKFHNAVDAIIPHNGTSNRDAAIDLGYSSGGRFKNLYLSGGVYLGGTGSANLLDDYEEGTWTPTNTGAALTVTQAKYTKVGRMVTVACFVTATANTSGDWGGLPFTIDVSGTYSGSVGYQNDTAGETWNVFADGGTSWTLRKGTTSEQLLSGKNLRMTLTYFTT